MALSRKQSRELKRLRKDATNLWSEQQSVIEHARGILQSAGVSAKGLAESELVPALQKSYDNNVRPSFDRSYNAARDKYEDASVRFNGKVLPVVAGLSGSLAGTVSNLASKNHDFKDAAGTAKKVSKELNSRAKKASKAYDKKYNTSGVGVGGWLLIGAGVAAVAAVGYALWQTFRADDDLWIADEELDAPVTTVSPASAAK